MAGQQSATQAIWNFLAGKGLSPAQIAGIMGNLEVESGFSGSSLNPGEGAIGIAQWEGGRRTALQNYARQHGGSEGDLNIQLHFLWSELTTQYPQVLQQIKASNDPGQVAAIWDGGYEISAGTSRNQRVADAQNILETYQSGGVAGLMHISSATATGGGGSMTAGGAATAAPSQEDFNSDLTSMGLGGLLKTVPELSNIVRQAVAGGWTPAKFQQAVENTHWYKTNNQATRSLISLKASDPAEYAARISAAAQNALHIASQLGVGIDQATANQFAYAAITGSWDTQTLTQRIGQYFQAGNYSSSQLSGGIATAYGQLKDLYASYGVPITETALQSAALQVAEGVQSADAYKQQAITQAKSLYPSLSSSLDQGLTVKDVAAPFQQTMANVLEIDPGSITLNDPLIKKALQGTVTTGANGSSEATTTPLYSFENTLRADPRWGKTQNARDTMSTALVKIGHDFGLSA